MNQLKFYSVGIVVLSLFTIFYVLNGIKDLSVIQFSNHYSDIILLGLLLLTIFQISNRNQNKVDPIFWRLLGTAFFSWFLLSFFKLFFWESISDNKRGLYSSISYFLFYALMIASIEVKSYSSARKFLNSKSLISSLSILIFLLGSFSYLILARGENNIQTQGVFYFYLLMDTYLVLRWLHLSWQSRNNAIYRNGFLLLGIASINWFFADLLELKMIEGMQSSSQSILTNISSNISENSHSLNLHKNLWLDWIWHLPFFIFYVGIKTLSKLNLNSKKSNHKNITHPKLTRYNLLNTPLFFLGVISLLFLIENVIFPQTSSTVLKNIQIIWVAVTLTLAMTQILQLFNRVRKQKDDLAVVEQSLHYAQQELREVQRHIDSQNDSNQILLDTIKNPIFTLNSKGVIISINQATCELLGYKEVEIVGICFTQFIPNTEELSYFFDYQSYRQKLARKEKGLELESKIITQDNSIIDIHVTISQGNINSKDNIIISLADIRKQKEIENQLHQLKDDITANISHEFRTPLTIVNGVLNDLITQSHDANTKEKLNTAKRNNHRLIHMVDQLLELSKSSNQSLPIVDLNATEWLPLICQSYEIIAREKEINYTINICENIFIRGNQQALENILYNLLSNAFKYTKSKGKIIVRLRETDSNYLLEVEDSGVGIPSNEQLQIFDRFHRVSGESSHNPGVGIGLSLVKNLVSSMDWKISLKSEVNQGSTFTVNIKKALDSNFKERQNISEDLKLSTNELPQELIYSTETNLSKKSQYLILIIEDNLDMQKYIQSVLSPHHQCIVANDGQQGVQLAEEILPDIIVSDVMMPKMDGFEVLKSIKTLDSTSHIPVILLTAKSDKKNRIKGLSAEADDYLTKPFDAEELVLKITNLLNTRKKLQQKFEAQWQGFTQNKNQPEKLMENDFLSKLNQLFEQNYRDSSFAMNQLASLLAMSERQLQRKVKALVNVSPLELLKRYRLEKAKLALQSETQIGLIAQNCGFSSQTYFGRCFKEHFGMTPKTYQKQ